jgi:hypothetical protein
LNLTPPFFLLIVFNNEAIADIVSIVLIASEGELEGLEVVIEASEVVTEASEVVMEASEVVMEASEVVMEASEVVTGALLIITVGSIECPTNFSYFFKSFA